MKKHRTQLLLEPDQYRWLRRRAGDGGSISAVVRGLIDEARRSETGSLADDPFIRYLLEEPPYESLTGEPTSVEDLDEQLYGYGQDEDRGDE
ncbi:MAG: hypothetical protein ACR2OC_08300 [Solirubrobacterales bacterium]